MKNNFIAILKGLIVEQFNQNDLIAAIENGQMIKFFYNSPSTKKGWRIVEPLAIGDSKAGNTLLRAYDIGKSGNNRQNWRLYDLQYIEKLTIHSFQEKQTKQNIPIKSNFAIRQGTNFQGDRSLTNVHKQFKK